MIEKLKQTDWSPERKVVGAAIAAVALGLAEWAGLSQPPTLLASSLPVVVAYLLPNKKA